jgi:hypothetical protein
MRRPNITPDDADAIDKLPSIAMTDVFMGRRPGGGMRERLYYRNQKTKQLIVFGTTERWPFVNSLVVESGRFFNAVSSRRRQNVAVIGQTAKERLVSDGGSDRQGGAAGAVPVHRHRRDGQTPEPRRL